MPKIANIFIKNLKTFDNKEFRTFEKWLKSPWCNSNKNLLTLFEVLKKQYPKFASKKLDHESLFRAAFPEKKYSYSWMCNLLSEGQSAAEDFLIHRELRQDENTRKNLLTSLLQKRGSDLRFFQISDKEINRLESKPEKDWEDYLGLLKLNRRVYHHPNQNPRAKLSASAIIKMNQNLDLAYLSEKASIINEMIFRNRILKDENHDVAAEIKNWRAASEGVEDVSIDFYRRRFGYTEENMLNEYWDLRFDFLEKNEDLNRKDLKIHLYALLNDSAFLLRKALIDFSDFFILYKLGLKTGAVLHNGVMTRVTYVTIVTVSDLVKDFGFTDQFIESYTSTLAPKIQSDALNWAKAHTAYSRGSFEIALQILEQNDLKNAYFKIMWKVLNLQTYFDLFLKDVSYQKFLFNYCKNFEQWIKRESNRSSLIKESYSNFIQKAEKLAVFYSDKNFRDKEIQELLLNIKNIQALNWLLQKQKEIINLRSN